MFNFNGKSLPKRRVEEDKQNYHNANQRYSSVMSEEEEEEDEEEDENHSFSPHNTKLFMAGSQRVIKKNDIRIEEHRPNRTQNELCETFEKRNENFISNSNESSRSELAESEYYNGSDILSSNKLIPVGGGNTFVYNDNLPNKQEHRFTE